MRTRSVPDMVHHARRLVGQHGTRPGLEWHLVVENPRSVPSNVRVAEYPRSVPDMGPVRGIQ
eukprot:587989-Rhodomonas_salina.2